MPDRYAYSSELVASGWKLDHEPGELDSRVSTVETKHGPVHLGVAVADARLPKSEDGFVGPTYIVGFGYEGRVDDPYETQPFQALAEHNNARVIMVDTPGFSDMSAKALISQRLFGSVVRGNFRPTATLMLRAIAQQELLQPGEGVSLMGYSMGAITVSNIAEILQTPGAIPHMPAVRINGVYLLDPTSLRGTLALKRDIDADKQESIGYYHGLSAERYEWTAAAEEVANPKAHRRRMRRQMAAYTLYGLGIARAQPGNTLAQAIALDREHGHTGLSEGTIRVIRGSLSRIASDKPTRKLLANVRSQLRESGTAYDHALPGETHFWTRTVELPAAAAAQFITGDR